MEADLVFAGQKKQQRTEIVKLDSPTLGHALNSNKNRFYHFWGGIEIRSLISGFRQVSVDFNSNFCVPHDNLSGYDSRICKMEIKKPTACSVFVGRDGNSPNTVLCTVTDTVRNP